MIQLRWTILACFKSTAILKHKKSKKGTMVIDSESTGWGWERNTMTNWSKRTLRLHSWKTIVLTISNRGSRAQNKWMKKAELAVKGLIIVQKHCYNKGVMYSPLWNFQTAPQSLFSSSALHFFISICLIMYYFQPKTTPLYHF